MQPIPKLARSIQGIATPRIFRSALLVFMLTTSGFANSVHGQPADDAWHLLKEQQGIQVFYLISTCDSQKILHFKIKNDATPKTIIWTAVIKDGDQVVMSLPSMAPKALTSEQELSSDCTNIAEELSLAVAEDFSVGNLQFNLLNI